MELTETPNIVQGAQRTVFAGQEQRERSGLLKRELGIFGVFLFTITGIGLFYSGLLPVSAIAGLYPGSNPLLVLAAMLLIALLFGYLYSAIAALAPHNGAEYLLSSRVLSPWLAFPASWATVLLASFAAGSVIAAVFQRVFPLFLQILVLVTDNRLVQSSLGWLESQYAAMLLGTLSVVLVFLMLILPQHITRRILAAGALLTMLAWSILCWQLSTHRADDFAAGYDAAQGAMAFLQHLVSARQMGMTLDPRPQTAVFAGLLMALWVIYGFQTVVNIGGEGKRGGHGWMAGILGGIVVCFAALGLAALFLGRAAPAQWLAAESFLYVHAPGTDALPWLPFYGALLVPSPALIWLVGAAWIFGTLTLAHVFLYAASRVVVAWSSDRILSQEVGYIHPALHSPVIAVLAVCILAEIGLAATVLDQAQTLLYQPYLLLFLLMAVPLVALAALPYRHPVLFAAAPRFVRWRIGTVPGISLLSGLAVLYLLAASAGNFFYQIFGGLNGVSIVLFGVLLGSGLLLYILRRAVLQDQGVDLEADLRRFPH